MIYSGMQIALDKGKWLENIWAIFGTISLVWPGMISGRLKPRLCCGRQMQK